MTSIMLWSATLRVGGSSRQHVNEAPYMKIANMKALRRLQELREKVRMLWNNYIARVDAIVTMQ
eukprot:12613692-Prorocentrum_lima.AAC.1